jgi:cytochrome c biogenesis protein CcdA
MRRLITSLAIVCALSAVAPALAGAAGGSAAQAITDCNNHSKLTAHYSAVALRSALATMPADVREYTDCYDVIEKQLFAQLGTSSTAGTGGSSSSSSGSVLPTWLLILIVIIALAALTFGALAIRRRRLEAQGGPDGPGQGGSGTDEGPGGPDDPGPPPGPGGSGGAGGPQ